MGTSHGCTLILTRREEYWWERRAVFNPGAVLAGGSVHLFYRAMGDDLVSRWGYARSIDGVSVVERLDYPVYEHPGSVSPYLYGSGGGLGGAEDPRVTLVGDRVYVTYTALVEYPRVAFTYIDVGDLLCKRWRWGVARIISPSGEVHKNWVLFPEKIDGKYALLTSITPGIHVVYLEDLDFEEGYLKSYYYGEPSGWWRSGWELVVKGAGAPPIKTREGWLLLYHAVPRWCPDCYAVGAALLDLSDPSRLLWRLSEPLISPTIIPPVLSDAKTGVVYSNGAVVLKGSLYVYYGVGDVATCVSRFELDELLEGVPR